MTPPSDDTRPPLLLTRPEAQSQRFARQFRNRVGQDWPVLLSPLARIDFLVSDRPPPDTPEILFTSENAVDAFARLAPGRGARAWCVGSRTAERAAEAGFADVRTGPGDGAGLAAMLRSAGVRGPCLHVRGTHVAADLAGRLAAAGIPVAELLAYAQVPLPLSPAAAAALAAGGPVLLPLFSPRSARLAAEAIGHPRARLLVACMSGAVADAAAPLHPARIVTAAHPGAAAMIDALRALIEMPA